PARRSARRAGSRGPSLLRDGIVDADAVEQAFYSRARVGQPELDGDIAQRWRQPYLRLDGAVGVDPLPDFGVDVAEGQRDFFGTDAAERHVIDLARGRDVELGLVVRRRREIE